MADNIPLSTSLTPADVEQLTTDRRAFHQHPELKYQEHLTARLVADRLSHYGYEVKTGVGRTGVVGLLEDTKQASEAGFRGAQSDGDVNALARTLVYRADMDALPISE